MISEIKSAEIKKLILYLIASSTVISIYAVAQKFGIDKDYWVEHSWERVFSTFGQPNWLAAFLVMVIPYTAILTFKNLQQFFKTPGVKKKFRLGSIFVITLAITSLQIAALIFTRSVSGYLALLVSLVILFLYYLVTWFSKKQRLLIPLLIIIISIPCFIFAVSPKSQSYLKDLFWEKETNQIRLIVWKGALDLISTRPIIGYGLETFAYSFLPFRPADINQTTEWNFLFNKPHNEYLEILSESGFIGLITYTFFISILVIWIYKKRRSVKNQAEIMALFAGFSGLLVTLFFGFQVVMTNLLFFLFPIFIIIISEINFTQKTVTLKISETLKTGFYVFFTLAYLTLNTFVIRYFLANVFYDFGSLYSLEKAVQYAPFENTYRRHLAYAYTQKISENSENEAKAVTEIDKTLQSNDQNYLNLQTLTQTYLELAQIDSKYFAQATELTEKQLALCPTDPEVYYTYGLLLMTQDNNEKAKEAFKKALELKPDYENALKMFNLF